MREEVEATDRNDRARRELVRKVKVLRNEAAYAVSLADALLRRERRATEGERRRAA
ncbi:MAG: hypothetical protein M3322_01310 [Actinomycetota bacterium]|nr:hypothetical protein [Actinomycetota bacterium]